MKSCFKPLFILTLLFWIAAPSFIFAQGFVPCGIGDVDPCQACHVVMLVENVLDWLVMILGIIATILIVVAGIKLATSGGNVSAMESAKRSINNLLIGYVIVLAGWLMVDTVMKVLVSDDGAIPNFGVWNSIECVVQPEAFEYVGRPTASGDNAAEFSDADAASRVAAIEASGEVVDDARAAAIAAGITDENEINHYIGLVSQESSLCQNKVGPDTGKGRGRAYGCTQMLVSTARGLDSGLSGLSDEQVAAKLRDDNAYSLSIGAKYYKQGLDKYRVSDPDRYIDFTLARYNGGDAAMNRSTSCDGQRWYECEANPGYAQTRHYVSNIRRVAENL